MIDRVVSASIKWWESKRPTRYSLEQHLENPTINCVGIEQEELAKAIGEYLEASIRLHKYLNER